MYLLRRTAFSENILQKCNVSDNEPVPREELMLIGEHGNSGKEELRNQSLRHPFKDWQYVPATAKMKTQLCRLLDCDITRCWLEREWFSLQVPICVWMYVCTFVYFQSTRKPLINICLLVPHSCLLQRLAVRRQGSGPGSIFKHQSQFLVFRKHYSEHV